MPAWTEHNGYWYEIQERQSGCFMLYVYDSMQRQVFSCACDTRDDARAEAESYIDNEAEW